MKLTIPFDNSFAQLDGAFYARQSPVPVKSPFLRAFNNDLARLLGITPGDAAEQAQVFGGNLVPDGADPLAQQYSGHQFGNYNPQLGDGRAVLLGEVVTPDGVRRDIQLKGSGRTPFSRGGDGRAWLGPVLREYVVSEAMFALGIPTTRALAAVETGEDVIREGRMPGAVLTRVAASHLRVGTFQIFAARGDLTSLRALTATGSSPTGTEARWTSRVERTSKISSRASGVFTAKSRLPSGERASGRTGTVSKLV